jgi:hypothetical protein
MVNYKKQILARNDILSIRAEICFADISHIAGDIKNRRTDMIRHGITILYQCGTEFRIGAYRGTQFRRNRPISSKNEIYHIKDRSQK